MSEESRLNQSTPLSQAQKFRRLNDNNNKIELPFSVSQLREVIIELIYSKFHQVA